MPVTVNTSIQGNAAAVSAIKALQTFLSQTVNVDIDNQSIAGAIITLQTYLETQAKFSASAINRSIDDQMLGAKIIELQVAANLP
jgi:hypothetical protein